METMKGFKAEMQGPGGDTDWATNGIVWPDAASADCAGLDLLIRCTHFGDTRVIEVDEKPNRPSYSEWRKSR